MSTNDSVALLVQGLTKHYNAQHGITNINLEIMRGEVFGFLGPNGAGKSTTINSILDILRPDEGVIKILGFDHHKEAKEAHRRLGYASGDMETDPTLTGKQYLRYAAHLYGGVESQQIELLATRLQADLSTKIKRLSRGNRLKIGLIAALMHEPEILILDEPTSGLDPLMQAEFNTIIREHKQAGKTVFVSSHVLSEVRTICDRVGFIRHGELVQVSSLEELLRRASRKVTIHFEDEVPTKKLAALTGIHDMKQDDGTVSFTFSGDINTLIDLLAAHRVKNLDISETDLEELFMNFYRKEESHV